MTAAPAAAFEKLSAKGARTLAVVNEQNRLLQDGNVGVGVFPEETNTLAAFLG